MIQEKILVTGPFGQVGTELVPELQKLHGKNNVIALGHHKIPNDFDGIVEKGDISSMEQVKKVIQKHSITQIYHLAALLSVTGEKNPQLAWQVNMLATKNLLDLSVEHKIKKFFFASSIAIFGPTTPSTQTPQHTSIEPTTMYGITKYTGELLAQYYHNRFGLDIRGLRYPGIISWKQLPGGGTTDYSIGIFYGAIQKGEYECFVEQMTMLPMIYMQDAIKATIQLMEAPAEQIKVRTAYNLSAISFTVKDLAEAINKRIPLVMHYKPDHRQKIADSWPNSIDDTQAKKDWKWKHQFDLQKLVDVMLENLKKKLQVK